MNGCRSLRKAQNDYITSFLVAFSRPSCHVAHMDIDTAARGLAELGNTTRLQIVRLLVRAGGEGLAIGELQSHLGVPPSTLAFHLRGLVTAGLVAQQREGRVVRCTPQYSAINETLAFVKEHCCAGFGDAAASISPTRPERTKRPDLTDKRSKRERAGAILQARQRFVPFRRRPSVLVSVTGII